MNIVLDCEGHFGRSRALRDDQSQVRGLPHHTTQYSLVDRRSWWRASKIVGGCDRS